MFIASSVKLCPSSVRSDMNVVSGNPALYLFNESKTITPRSASGTSAPIGWISLARVHGKG